MSNYLNLRQTYLNADYLSSNAPATSYDTDLENFWTQNSIIKFNKFSLNNKLKH